MNEIKLTEEQVLAAYKAAKSDETREALKALFPCIKEKLEKRKPTLDDYTTITSYEDACEALGESPILSENHIRRKTATEGDVTFLFSGWVQTNVHAETPLGSLPRHIVALMKLEAISRALWGRKWQPNPDAEGREKFHWPLFILWTNNEINGFNGEEKRAILSAAESSGTTAGFGCMSNYNSSYSPAVFGFRLCQETEEKARYFGGRNFVKLWAEYLAFRFTTGDFYTDKDFR